MPWGKGHAWNPLSFLDSPRDPLDPDMPHTGLIFLGTEYEREFPPGPDPLQGLTFTSVIFPVQEKINEEFGHPNHWNMAGKLSLLFWNTEIDWVVLKGKSRPERYGFDFSRKLNPFLELYADYWTSPQYEKVFLDQSGKLWKTEYTAFCSSGGLRYERWGTCWTVEYYRNKAGFNPEEMDSYYNYLQTVVDGYPKEGGAEAGQRMVILSKAYYQHPTPMQEYAYTQILTRAPLGIQHLTCSIAGVWNLQDQSYAICPGLRYDSKPNLNVGLKSTFWQGNPHTEFGEKINHWIVEASLTYSFEFSKFSLSDLPSYLNEPRQEETYSEEPRQEEPYSEEPHQEEPHQEKPYRRNPIRRNPIRRNPIWRNPTMRNLIWRSLTRRNHIRRKPSEYLRRNPMRSPRMRNPTMRSLIWRSLTRRNHSRRNPVRRNHIRRNPIKAPHLEHGDKEGHRGQPSTGDIRTSRADFKYTTPRGEKDWRGLSVSTPCIAIQIILTSAWICQ